MIDAQGMSQSSETPGIASLPAAAPTQAPAASTEEKVFRQSEVNSLVGRAKAEERARAIEEYKRSQPEQPQNIQQLSSQPTQPQQNQEQEIRRLAAEETQKHIDKLKENARLEHETREAQNIVNNFWNKTDTGKQKYQDFEQVTKAVPLVHYPSVVQMLATSVENAADVFYHLAKNEGQMADIEKYAQDERYRHIAFAQMNKLSQSLKDNEAASKMRVPNEPLSQMRPSNTGTDNGVMSVGDFRKKYRV